MHAQQIADQITLTARALADTADVVDIYDAARHKSLQFLQTHVIGDRKIRVTVTGGGSESLLTYDDIARSAAAQAIDHATDLGTDLRDVVIDGHIADSGKGRSVDFTW